MGGVVGDVNSSRGSCTTRRVTHALHYTSADIGLTLSLHSVLSLLSTFDSLADAKLLSSFKLLYTLHNLVVEVNV